MSHTPDGAPAPASSNPRRRFNFEPRPIDPAIRRRRIKIAREFCLIARTKCSVAVALRACGLDHDHNAREDVADLLDRRNIPRIRKGVRRVRFKETPSRVFEEFIPRQEPTLRSVDLAEMVAELREIADPLGDDHDKRPTMVRLPKPPMICACTVCGVSFESKQRRARYCGGACRIKHWRAEQ
jgi:hypothetical protein